MSPHKIWKLRSQLRNWWLLCSGNAKDVLLVDCILHVQTVNAVRNWNIKQTEWSFFFSKENQDVILLHDNISRHLANLTNEWLVWYGWNVLLHPPLSPNLVPSDCHLFGSFIFIQKVALYRCVAVDVQRWLQVLNATFFE